MGVKGATGCLHWSQSSISHSSSSSFSPQTLASAISSPLSKRHSLTDVTLICRYVHRSSVFGNKLNRSRSCETLKSSRNQHSIKRIVSANFDSRFSKEINEFAFRFQLSDDGEIDSNQTESESDSESKQQNPDRLYDEFASSPENWSGDLIPVSIERKANSVQLPFSLRIIQKKKQWEDGFIEVKDSAYCSVKKAFSSMVFIIRELQSYTLQMREILLVEDLQEILIRVQKEMNASFVWLFQQVFSHTPNLMVYVMILLANYSVHSMSNNISIASPLPPATVESVSTISDQTNSKFDSSTVKFFTDLDGTNGGGGKPRPLATGTDGDGKFDGGSPATVDFTRTGEESVEEGRLWKLVVAEAEKMQGVIGDGGIDRETMARFLSPVTVKLEEEMDTDDYLKTELVYKTGLLEEPNNPLLLANYAQFLYLFAHDHKRAEIYFKRASQIEPKDAEALSKYASFLWHAKNDLWAAEETFLEAIDVDPNNSFYTASYARFLWSNGADDTCFPLESPEM